MAIVTLGGSQGLGGWQRPAAVCRMGSRPRRLVGRRTWRNRRNSLRRGRKSGPPIVIKPVTCHGQTVSGSIATVSRMGAAGEVIAINLPLLTMHAFPPVELDYDIIRPKRVMRQRAMITAHGSQ